MRDVEILDVSDRQAAGGYGQQVPPTDAAAVPGSATSTAGSARPRPRADQWGDPDWLPAADAVAVMCPCVSACASVGVLPLPV